MWAWALKQYHSSSAFFTCFSNISASIILLELLVIELINILTAEGASEYYAKAVILRRLLPPFLPYY